MNRRDREQLRATIAKDLAEGQGEHCPTRELLKQYAPLDGILTAPESDDSPGFPQAAPVENSMAPRATVARNDGSAWHGATVAQHATVAAPATVARYAMVKGELRVPNTINFSLFPTLDPYAKAVYYQLFLLSHGFRRDTCMVSLAKLSQLVLMSQRKVQNTIAYLEKSGLIKRVEPKLGGPSKGNLYQVPFLATDIVSDATMACGATVASRATPAQDATQALGATLAYGANNKEKHDDDIENKSSSKGANTADACRPVENHSSAAAPRERQESADRHFALVRAAYEKATGNRWNKLDTQAYEENGLRKLPAERITSALEAVSRRTPTRINSFRYFIKEILALEDPSNRAWQKKHLEKIVRRIRDCSVGSAGYSAIDFREDVKCACAREGVVFDDDIYNELGERHLFAR